MIIAPHPAWIPRPINIYNDRQSYPTIAFTGPRPSTLYGYTPEPYLPLFYTILNALNHWATTGTHTIRTGGAQGFDQTVFWAAHTLKQTWSNLSNHLYISLPGQANTWARHGLFGQQAYASMCQHADQTITASQTPNSRVYHQRNQQMITCANLLIARYPIADNPLQCTGRTASTIRRALGNHQPIYLLDPTTLHWATPYI